MGINFDLEDRRRQVEVEEKWRELINKIPGLHFDPEWEVKIIPPFGGAMARFWIDYNGNHVSVYLDTMSRLGWMYDEKNDVPIPYWELYPARRSHGDVCRYYIGEENQMMNDIRETLEFGIDREDEED